MDALCGSCRKPVEASYVFVDGRAELHRLCPEHGRTTSVVASDGPYFAGCLNHAAATTPPLRRGLVVELLDGCNVRCPTCIAGSSPALRGLKDVSTVAAQLEALNGEATPMAVFLSGGEPTIHPGLGDFVHVVENLPVTRRILITNGLRLGDDAFAAELEATMSKPWEVFLQFDSLRPYVLRNIRGADLSAARQQALAFLERSQIATTLVCVIKRGFNLDEVAELVEYAKSWDCVTGIQFQPIREAGRLENYDSETQSCDLGAVRRALVDVGAVPDLVPHPASPLAIALARFDRDARAWHDPTVVAGDYFVEPTHSPDGALRISVMEYSDFGSWSTLRSAWSPFNALQVDGQVTPLDEHFLGLRPRSITATHQAV